MSVLCLQPNVTPSEKAPGAVDISSMLAADFVLQSGERLSRAEFVLRVHGDLRNPAVIIAGGISACRKVADCGAETGWWRDVVGSGRAIDLQDYCVIGFDFLPGAAETARTITTGDQARALSIALENIGVGSIHAFVGASYGGMVALAFAERFPDRLSRLCAISAADRPHPTSTALRGVQRRIVEFARRAGDPSEGVSLARQIAMVTYRTPQEFAARFGREPGPRAGDPYPVCDYLISRGRAYDMAADRFVTLSDSIDRHVADPTRIMARSLFIASSSDWLVPTGDVERLAALVVNSKLQIIDSRHGHDAFLKDAHAMGPIINSFLRD